jgi:hypothetical protein
MAPPSFPKMTQITKYKLFEKKALGSPKNRVATKTGFFKKPIKPKSTRTNRSGAK